MGEDSAETGRSESVKVQEDEAVEQGDLTSWEVEQEGIVEVGLNIARHGLGSLTL